MTESLILTDKPKSTAAACGNCHYSGLVPQDMNLVVCNGSPPTPVMVGVRQPTRIGAQPEPIFDAMRPTVVRTLPACALWKLKAGSLVGNA